MAAVEKPQRAVEAGKAHISGAEDMEVDRTQHEEAQEDLYTRLKTWQRQLEFYEIQV